ncbi:MAG: CBS domain-containing protein [Conexivisphaerales archaeon]
MVLVRDLMRKKVFTLSKDKSVKDAAKLMQKNDVSSVLVESGDVIVGIVTERDIVRKIVAEGFDPSKVLLQDIMTSPLIVVSPDATIEDASRLMVTFGVRRLPVMQDRVLVGIISASDIAAHLAREKKYEDNILNAVARVSKEELPPSYG